VGLAHAELEARGLELRSIRFAAPAHGEDPDDGGPDDGGSVELVVTGELRRAS
jgi:hypothetical protein